MEYLSFITSGALLGWVLGTVGIIAYLYWKDRRP
jgi:hypothetical protein